MIRCMKAGIKTPIIRYVDVNRYCIFMSFIDGYTVRDYINKNLYKSRSGPFPGVTDRGGTQPVLFQDRRDGRTTAQPQPNPRRLDHVQLHHRKGNGRPRSHRLRTDHGEYESGGHGRGSLCAGESHHIDACPSKGLGRCGAEGRRVVCSRVGRIRVAHRTQNRKHGCVPQSAITRSQTTCLWFSC